MIKCKLHFIHKCVTRHTNKVHVTNNHATSQGVVRVYKRFYTLSNAMVVGYGNLCGVSWKAFMDEDS